MRSTLNNACISALLCGAVLVTPPAVAAGAGAGTSAGGMSTSGDNNTATTANNMSSANTADKTPAHRMSKKAQANANTAEVETTRQLNQQQAAAGANGAAGATAQ